MLQLRTLGHWLRRLDRGLVAVVTLLLITLGITLLPLYGSMLIVAALADLAERAKRCDIAASRSSPAPGI